MYINKVDDIVEKYNSTYHTTIKIEPLDPKSSKYIYCGEENNDKDPKFEVSGHVKIKKYKNNFAESNIPN